MIFKHLLAAVALTILGTASLGAQTASEIIRRMSEEMARGDAEGMAMTFVLKVPALGEISSYSMMRADKSKIEISGKEKNLVVWTDSDTKWEYDLEAGEIAISAREPLSGMASQDSDLSRFENICEGYDPVLQKEDDEAWYITCRKKKDNHNKDDFKKMNVVVAKDSFLPLELSGGEMGFKISILDFSLGVSEAEVTFRAADYPGVRVSDDRQR